MPSRESMVLTGMAAGVLALFTTLALRKGYADGAPTAAVLLLSALLVAPLLLLALGLLRQRVSSLAMDLGVLSLLFGPVGLALRGVEAPAALSGAYLLVPAAALLAGGGALFGSFRKRRVTHSKDENRA